MRSRFWGCIAAVLLLVLLGRLGVLTPISDWLWHWHEVRTPWVRSPDGQWSAQVRLRGFMDNVVRRLYLRCGDQKPVMVCQVGSPSTGGLQWSPDSRRIAGANVYILQGDYRIPWTIWVYDVVSKHEADGYGEDPEAPPSPAQRQMNEKRERELFDKPDSVNKFKWKWRGSKEIVGYVEDYRADPTTTYPLFVYSIDDTSSQLRIKWRRIK
jgi:hypothetical protein